MIGYIQLTKMEILWDTIQHTRQSANLEAEYRWLDVSSDH